MKNNPNTSNAAYNYSGAPISGEFLPT